MNWVRLGTIDEFRLADFDQPLTNNANAAFDLSTFYFPEKTQFVDELCVARGHKLELRTTRLFSMFHIVVDARLLDEQDVLLFTMKFPGEQYGS